jgi:hypothetical protein
MQTRKEARIYAYDLVSDGKSQYHMLDEHEASVLTGLVINSTDKIHIWEYITEADFKNELPGMLSEWLISGNDSLGLHILDTLRHNAIRYASKECVSLLEEQEEEYKLDLKDIINHE